MACNNGNPTGDDPSQQHQQQQQEQESPWYEESQPGTPHQSHSSHSPGDEVTMTVKPMDRIRVGLDYQYDVSIISMERDDESIPCVVTLNARGLTAFIWHLRTVLHEMERTHRPPPVSFY